MKILTGLLVGMLWFSGAAWGGDFTINSDGTVTDNVTGLMWQRQDDGVVRNWEAAITNCENLTLASHVDWRLPNINELESITDESRLYPAIDAAVFPSTKRSGYWSSTTFAPITNYAWAVDFEYGALISNYVKPYGMYVRCVRG